MMVGVAKNLLRRFTYFNYNYTLEFDAEPLKAVPENNRILHVGESDVLLHPQLRFYTGYRPFSPNP